MKESCSEIPLRLRKYRKILKLTRKEISRWLGIRQSHSYQLKSGYKIIALKSLRSFAEQGGDICYTITGRKQTAGLMDEYLGQCRTDYGKNKLIKMMLWLNHQGLFLRKKKGDVINEIGFCGGSLRKIRSFLLPFDWLRGIIKKTEATENDARSDRDV